MNASSLRSNGPALFAGGAYIAQLWLFWLAPVLLAVPRNRGHPRT